MDTWFAFEVIMRDTGVWYYFVWGVKGESDVIVWMFLMCGVIVLIDIEFNIMWGV